LCNRYGHNILPDDLPKPLGNPNKPCYKSAEHKGVICCGHQCGQGLPANDWDFHSGYWDGVHKVYCFWKMFRDYTVRAELSKAWKLEIENNSKDNAKVLQYIRVEGQPGYHCLNCLDKKVCENC
jgi:hypothetical protein